MPSAMEVVSHRVTLTVMLVGLLGTAMAFLDSRHSVAAHTHDLLASAADVQELSRVIQEERIEEIEFKIEDAERRIARMHAIPDSDLTPWMIQELEHAINERERCLRKLQRIIKNRK